MKTLILICLILHITTATVDLEGLKSKATTKLEKIRDTATSTVEKLTEYVDLETLKKYDYLHLLPKIEFSGKLIEDKIMGLPEKTKKLQMYLQTLKSLEPKDLLLAFDGDVPWPARRRMDLEQYFEEY